ncbi:UGT-49 protein [Aphelenchoides avenae]|nr:UGT-49 protein [Aphelenchus avenae]
MRIFFLFLLSHALPPADAKRRLKVLVSVPGLGYSHLALPGRLADLLVDAGHEVHVFITELNPKFASHNGSAKAHRIIRYAPKTLRNEKILQFGALKNPFTGMHNILWDGTFEKIQALKARYCRDLLTSSDGLLDTLRRERYDVLVAESIEMCAFDIGHALGIPTRVAVIPSTVYNHVGRLLGVPTPPSFVGNMMAASLGGDRMSYRERARNLFWNFYDWYYTGSFNERMFDPIFRSRFGADFPSVDRIFANVSLTFLNSNEFFDIARPTLHKIIYIGGIALVEPKSWLSSTHQRARIQDIEEIFQKAAKGVVLFSFGSLADISKMSLDMGQSFVRAFRALFEAVSNILVFDWLDQVSILGKRSEALSSENTGIRRRFGLNSVNEASALGVPMVCIPLFADHLYKSVIAVKLRAGVHLDVRNSTEQRVFEALIELLNDVSYRDKELLIKQKLQSHPFRPRERSSSGSNSRRSFPT